MAIKFGKVEYSEKSFEEQIFHKNQIVDSASAGTHYHLAVRDHYPSEDIAHEGVLSSTGSHWAFIHTMFYSSGSTKINPDEREKFNSIYNKFNQHNDLKPFYNNKFYDSASVFYIPQQLFGERIKPGTFELTARSGSSSSSLKSISILDDGNGNLYSSNLHHSYSNTAFSSSDNYVGNIYYDLGIATLTETGSWSGSVSYLDIGGNSDEPYRQYPHWNIKFNSTTPIFTSQYTIKIPAGQFNHTMNATTKPYNGGDYTPSGSSVQDISNPRQELLTGSFSPYFTQIHLYESQVSEPVLVANVPKAIKMRDDVDLIITFRVDH